MALKRTLPTPEDSAADDLAADFPALSLSEERLKMEQQDNYWRNNLNNARKQVEIAEAEVMRLEAVNRQLQAQLLQAALHGGASAATQSGAGQAQSGPQPISAISGEQHVKCPGCAAPLVLVMDLTTDSASDAAALQPGALPALASPNTACARPLALKIKLASASVDQGAQAAA